MASLRSRAAAVVMGISIVALCGGRLVTAQKPNDAIASLQSEIPGMVTDLTEVKRMSDNTVRVMWRWRNTTAKPVHVEGIFETAYLLDPVNKKKHLVVTDANRVAIGTSMPYDQTDIQANAAVSMWARFPAPPDAVGKMTVVLAKTPPFEDIPITK